MASGTNYSQEYELAEKAYREGNYTQAAEIIERLAEEFSDNPNVLLLKGHIYCSGFGDYELAKEQYEAVLGLSSEQDLVDCAYNAIEQVQQLQEQSEDLFDLESEQSMTVEGGHSQAPHHSTFPSEDSPYGVAAPFQTRKRVTDSSEDDNLANFESDQNSDNEIVEEDFDNPFIENAADTERDEQDEGNPFIEFDNFDVDGVADSNFLEFSAQSELSDLEDDSETGSINLMEDEDDYAVSNSFAEFETTDSIPSEDNNFVEEFSNPEIDSFDDEDDFDEDLGISDNPEHNFAANSDLEIDTVLTEPHAIDNSEGFNFSESSEHDGLDYQDELEFDEIDSSFFDLEELEQGLPDTGIFNVSEDLSGASSEPQMSQDLERSNLEATEEDFAAENIDSSIMAADSEIEPIVEVQQGFWGGFFNATMPKKQLITACCTGLISAIAVLGVGIGSQILLTPETEDNEPTVDLVSTSLMALVAGVASFGTTMFFGSLITKQIDRSTQNLQSQFDDVYQGNLNAKATVFSQDEFGRLATGFNRMTRVILTTTQEAQRRAEETEQAKEDLQRQVIRLLDDVEGAARGDLTVQATVTADVLGAVADAFNLTIQSLREIVRQVKEAAEQVNKSSTDSELFARNQSSEALRMAEELAVTLNSVQMMTESIERVAENAREAEEVARSSSVTALRGGKAVESTVAGIFQIRETVSETARKVKRLAEASQEISKIVLLISQIAERTNQLALNASIQAAKAGEAGRGFAVVADEVRQLADRSGKSLKEIEQIVLQIQSETGSVMTAMEEGIQEVIDVTDRADQAKTALEDIIQVSNRIDTLVRSITADTVEQRENSRAVAQVMQSVELTAQATSQESQRVAGSLQSLVGIARNLLSSVERFRIDKNEE